MFRNFEINIDSNENTFIFTTIILLFVIFILGSTVTTEGDEGRILQFVSSFNNSRLGHLFGTLSAEDRTQYGHNYLQDFLLLSLKIKSKDELMVLS